MNIARRAIDSALLTWILMLGCLAGGIWGYLNMGRLEDPAFTIKQAVVTTSYPGASAEQVALEVSEPLESAIQQMAQLDLITSSNKPGLSRITVEIKPTYPGAALPQIWDELRNRVNDARPLLPDGAGAPRVDDGFGDVYGLFYAVAAPGYDDAEIHEIATFLRRELLTVDGVADVQLQGLPEEAVYVMPDMAILSNLGVSPGVLIEQIQAAAEVTDAGSLVSGRRRFDVSAPDGADSVQALAELAVGVGGEVLRMTDIAEVKRARVEVPRQIIRFNGQEAFTLGIAGLSSENIVEVGAAVEAKLDALQGELPWGVALNPIYQQHLVVDMASSDFLMNLAASVVIVVVVLAVFMGWRSAVVVGATLLLTVVGTLFFMALAGIEMQRISLGALIIAMGMLVDNAIVVAEGMQMKMLAGRSSRQAADEVATRVQIPLLGATVIGIMAFAGIGLSPDSTGEFLFSLFAVIGISLLLSWILALTATPLLAHLVFKQGAEGGSESYDGPIFSAYRRTLRGALAFRWLVLIGLVALTATCFWGFTKVQNQFFPDSNAPLFYVHYKLPQGTDLRQVAEDLEGIEDWLLARDDVESVSTFVGGGATRFMLTYSPHEASPSYGHLIVRVKETPQIPAVRAALIERAHETLPEGEFRTERLAFGPGGGAAIEARVSGRDPAVLRRLGERIEAAMEASGAPVEKLRLDWREMETTLTPIYATSRAQAAGVSRGDLAKAAQMATEGTPVAVYQEQDRRIPILLRSRQEGDPSDIDGQIVYSEALGDFIPFAQLIEGWKVEGRDTLIRRRDRAPTLTVQGSVAPGANTAAAFRQIRPAVEALDLPPGYKLEWGGEYENSRDAQASLGQQLPLSLLIMVLISIFLFGRLRQPLIVWLLVPMAVNGVVIGLLVTGLPFSFTALLGLLSLSGMLIKNGIVLVEEIDLVRAEGVPFREAIVEASTSRLRPVFLAAATTILGMAPLLSDAFFASMSVTIMGGLAFATVLTLIAAPVLYLTLVRDAPTPKPDGADAPEPA